MGIIRWVKYLCPACDRLVSPNRVRVLEDRRIELVCPRCEGVERIDAAALDAPQPHPRRDENGDPGHGEKGADDEATKPKSPAGEDREAAARCPKCGAQRRDAESCPSCGLVYDRWDPSADAGPSPELIAAWERLERDWQVQAEHDRFVRLCFEHDALAWAARCYRGRERDTIAERQMGRLTSLVEQAMRGAALAERPDPRNGRIVGWIALAGVVIAILVLVARYLRLG